MRSRESHRVFWRAALVGLAVLAVGAAGAYSYSASFAALPVLTELAARWKPEERAQPLAMAAAILVSDDVRGCREELLRPVEWVVPRLRELCRESLAQPGATAEEYIYLLQAARALDGDRFWGRELHYLASGEFPGVCPSCRADLYLVIGEYGFFTTAEEWIRRPDVARVAIEPNQGRLPEVGEWLLEHTLRAGQTEVAEQVRHLFGATSCPNCRHRIGVLDALADS